MANRDVQVLSDSIADKIKRKIIKGELRVNERLPNEQTLAEQLKVSRTTLREAVKLLVSKNILYIDRGKGTFVVNTPGLVEDPLGLEFVQEELLLRHLCEYRLGMEPYVSRLAAERATQKQITMMGKIVSHMVMLEEELPRVEQAEEKDHVLDKFANLDAEFHSLLYQMTQNTIFQRLSPVINNTVLGNYTSDLYRFRKQRLLYSETHKAVYEAIRTRNVEMAAMLTQKHMEIMQENLRDNIEKHISPTPR